MHDTTRMRTSSCQRWEGGLRVATINLIVPNENTRKLNGALFEGESPVENEK
jgi:hypothetical protein